jgi:hypothetical protein
MAVLEASEVSTGTTWSVDVSGLTAKVGRHSS